MNRSDGGIERGKHFGRRQYAGAGQRIEQGRLAGVGVTDQRYRRHRSRFPALPLLGSNASNVFELLLDVTNAASNFSPIGLELGFTRTTRADSAPELGHLDAASRKARQHVVQLGKFDLQLTFTSARMSRKNVEDELRAVDDTPLNQLFNIALLRGTEIVIKKKNIGVHRSH